MRKPNDTWRQKCAEMAAERMIREDLFSRPNPVVTVKVGGEPFGELSREAVRRGGRIPILALGTTAYVAPFIFVALWQRDNSYTDDLISDCAASAFRVASSLGFEEVTFPVIGGNRGVEFLWAAERGIREEIDRLEARGENVPEHVYAVDPPRSGRAVGIQPEAEDSTQMP